MFDRNQLKDALNRLEKILCLEDKYIFRLTPFVLEGSNLYVIYGSSLYSLSNLSDGEIMKAPEDFLKSLNEFKTRQKDKEFDQKINVMLQFARWRGRKIRIPSGLIYAAGNSLLRIDNIRLIWVKGKVKQRFQDCTYIELYVPSIQLPFKIKEQLLDAWNFMRQKLLREL